MEDRQLNQPTEPSVPSDASLKNTMSAFKESQRISEAKAREIEQGTRAQRLSSLLDAIGLQLQILDMCCYSKEKHHQTV